MYAIDTASEQAISARGSTLVTTTLYELLASLQTAGQPDEDALIVALVTSWARAGRITFMNSETSYPACSSDIGDPYDAR